MGWEDRPYYRDRPSSGGNPLMWLLTGSVPLFTAFRIHVRAHASLVAGSACDATKPSLCFARSASANGRFQCRAIASVTCLPARPMLREKTALPFARTTTSVRS